VRIIESDRQIVNETYDTNSERALLEPAPDEALPPDGFFSNEDMDRINWWGNKIPNNPTLPFYNPTPSSHMARGHHFAAAPDDNCTKLIAAAPQKLHSGGTPENCIAVAAQRTATGVIPENCIAAASQKLQAVAP
jgi:hypothetical protein